MHRFRLSLLMVGVVFLLLVFSVTRVTSEEKARLKIELHTFWMGSYSFAEIHVINAGSEEVTVLTNGWDIRKKEDGEHKAVERTLVWEPQRTSDGKKLIPSFPSFDPVTLERGEVALIRPVTGALQSLPKDGYLTVSYEIAEEWGKRFNIWHGKVSAEPIPIRDGGAVTSTLSSGQR